MKSSSDKSRSRRVILALLMGVGLTGLVLLVMWRMDTYEQFELKTLDFRFQMREKLAPIPHTSRLVHVDIDDQSIATLGRWPWGRKTHATFVSTLAALAPRAIVFDVEFPDPIDPGYDPILVRDNMHEAIEKADKSVFDRPVDIIKTADLFLKQSGGEQISEAQVRELENKIKNLGRMEEASRKALQDAVLRARVNDDAVFAEAIRRAGVVYLPISFEQEGGWGADPGVVRAVREMLTNDILPDGQMISARLGISPGELPPSLRSIKEKAAYDRAWEMITRNEATTNEEIWRSLAPGTKEPVETLSLPEGDVVRRACRMVRGVLAQAPKCALQVETSRLTERDPVRFEYAAVPVLGEASRSGGFVSVKADRLDGKLRRLKLIWQSQGTWYPQHMMRVAMDLYDVPQDGVTVEEGPTIVLRPRTIPPIAIPIDDRGQTVMNWAAGEWKNYLGRHISYSNVVQLSRRLIEIGRSLQTCMSLRGIEADSEGWEEAVTVLAPDQVLDPKPSDMKPVDALTKVKKIEKGWMKAIDDKKKDLEAELANLPPAMQNRSPGQNYKRILGEVTASLAQAKEWTAESEALEDHLRAAVAGRLCLIGSTTFSSSDIKATPLDPMFPGVSLHSNLFNMLETRAFLTQAKTPINMMLTTFIGLFVTLMSIRSGAVRAGLLSVGIVLTYVLAGFWAFVAHGFWIDYLGPILAATICYLFIATYKEYFESQQRKKVEGLWGQYVSPSVIDLLLKNPELQQIFAERRIVTMLFSDVAGFTKESERLSAEIVRDLINNYLEEMSAPIVKYDGYLNKYEGDAIMAFWGAPVPQPDQAVRSCYAALDMMDKLRALQKMNAEKGLPLMHTRIGINTGLVFVGNFGSKMKLDYTAIGDHVNLASRLEGANKAFKTGIIVADATYSAAKEFVEVRKLGRIRVVGRDTPVGIHELLARKGELPAELREARDVFEEGLSAFEKREFERAHARFMRVQEILPKDGPSRVYLDAISTLASVDLPPEWDGVITLESK